MHGIGMLWYDPDKKPLGEKLEAAAAYYARKYGRRPTIAHVNPGQVQESCTLAGMTVKPSKIIRLNHYWIGAAES